MTKARKLISKLDLCGGGSFSTAIFNSDIQLSIYTCSCFISVCPFVALLKETFTDISHVVLVDIKKLSFLTSCVFQFALLNAILSFIWSWFGLRGPRDPKSNNKLTNYHSFLPETFPSVQTERIPYTTRIPCPGQWCWRPWYSYSHGILVLISSLRVSR